MRQNQQDNEHRNIIREQILRKGYAHQYDIRRFIPCGREKANQILAQEMLEAERKWKENIEMILQTNDHVTFIKSIIRNASEEGRCVNEIESEEIANSLKAMLQECDDLENYMVTANQNTIKYESLIMKLNELMNCISEYPWVLDTAIDGIGELIVKVNQKAHL